MRNSCPPCPLGPSGWLYAAAMSKQSSRGPEWEAKRLHVLNRDGWICSSCGKLLEGDDATVDHIIAIENGGTDDLDNLISMCRADNGRKGAQFLIRLNYFNPRWLASVD